MVETAAVDYHDDDSDIHVYVSSLKDLGFKKIYEQWDHIYLNEFVK